MPGVPTKASEIQSLSCHLASTTYRQMTEAEQRSAGVTPETLCLCIGIEHLEDMIADRAWAAARLSTCRRWLPQSRDCQTDLYTAHQKLRLSD